MLLMLMALLEDLENGTDNYMLFFDTTMEACLAQGIPPEHQVAVMNAWTQLVTILGVEEGKIARRGISPN